MKKTTAVILCALFVFLLTACGEKALPDNGDTTASAVSDDKGETSENSGEIKELAEKYGTLAEDGLKWEYNTASKTIVISGEGAMRNYFDEAPEWDKYSAEAEKIVIGDKVTSVGAGAFYLFSAVTEVTLGEAVEYIGDSAFAYCEFLRSVNFPAGLKYVGGGAFNNDLLHSENGFAFPEGMLYIGPNAFHSAFKEGTVSIPASLSVIEDGAFANMFVSAFIVDEKNPAYASVDGVLYDKQITALINYPSDKRDTVFEIPDTVKTIRKDAVEVTNTLEKIVIPASVDSIEENAVFWNYALSAIEVDEGSAGYKSVDGVLFSKDGKNLLCYPIASDRTEYTIPEGTEKICAHAMSQAKNLTEIHIGEGLTEIGDFGMYLCENLSMLGLPESLTGIGDSALSFCDALTEIRYAGTDEEWKSIETGKNNDKLTDGSVRVFCAG